MPSQPHAKRLLAVLALAACSAPPAPPPAPAEPAVDGQRILAHTRFLASDLLEGRGPGTRGEQLAREYIASQLQIAGCRPGGADGGFMQPVPILGITTQVTAPFVAKGAAGDATLQAVDDFTAVAGSPAATAAWTDAELVFVGYGITAPEQRWDDYGGVDVRGKVLLVMNDDPSDDPTRFGGKARLYYGRWSYKFEEAARRGALGAMIIHTNASAGYPFQVIQANHGRENFWLPFRDGEPTLGIRSWVSENTAKNLCALGGHDLDELRTAAQRQGHRPVPLGVQVSLAIANTTREIQSGNVVGVLPGSDPALAQQHVVVTAHWDHLGIGTPRRDEIAACLRIAVVILLETKVIFCCLPASDRRGEGDGG